MLELIERIEDVFWTYGGIPLLLSLGVYLSFKSRFFQIRQLPVVVSIFKKFARERSHDNERGVKPIHAFFASVGGCVGVGNIIGVCTAVQVGGPGAVFWMWITALVGMLVKYGEIFLGIKFRIQDKNNSYFGGPMIYLKKVPGGKWLAPIFSVLLCLYGIEIYIFRVLTHSISEGWGINSYGVIAFLLLLILGIGQGGVKLVGKLSSFVIPVFLVIYSFMSFWIFVVNFYKIPGVFISIFTHAFQPHAALGAFAGSSIIISMSHGMRRACYTGDIGIGYASTIHSETQEAIPQRQAALGIIDIILDTFIVCTLSVLIILVTGTWHQGISANFVVAESFSHYFPYVRMVWPFFILLLGYSSLLAFFAAGRRSAMLLLPKYGSAIFMTLATCSFLIFSFIGTLSQCMAIMAIVGMLLLSLNLYGLFWLKDEIIFDLKSTK
ncbi:sodium:alanine symporter family protein [Candidatus Dependentiae bacterium]|nr:sodium:alanine symporter family protein [Candidatus Dependentiae bacterium]